MIYLKGIGTESLKINKRLFLSDELINNGFNNEEETRFFG